MLGNGQTGVHALGKTARGLTGGERRHVLDKFSIFLVSLVTPAHMCQSSGSVSSGRDRVWVDCNRLKESCLYILLLISLRLFICIGLQNWELLCILSKMFCVWNKIVFLCKWLQSYRCNDKNEERQQPRSFTYTFHMYSPHTVFK